MRITFERIFQMNYPVTSFVFVLVQCVFLLECTDRPIVGILSQEFIAQTSNQTVSSFIVASYVKAVEASGARVVPIHIKKHITYYRHLLRSVNGVVIPGGGAPLLPGNGFYDAVVVVYKLAKQMNDDGVFFPILGICLGFEALLIADNNNRNLLYRCNVLNENHPLVFAKNFRQTLTYAHLPDELHTFMKYFDVLNHHHRWCITRTNVTRFSLDERWLITGTNVDVRGVQYVSSAEHKTYPFVGLQFHVEKQYEWNRAQNNLHTRIAIKTNRYFYDLIVALTRRNDNSFRSQNDERDALIYNYLARPTSTGRYDQLYSFEVKRR